VELCASLYLFYFSINKVVLSGFFHHFPLFKLEGWSRVKIPRRASEISFDDDINKNDVKYVSIIYLFRFTNNRIMNKHVSK